MKIGTGILSWVLLALLALSSAILCIASPSLGYVGPVYGIFLAVYFVTCRGIRSAARLITLVVVSAVSWPIAYFGSLVAAGHIPGGTVHHGDVVDPAFPLIAFGGVLGGVALLIPVLLLFKPRSVSLRATLVKTLLGILLSGIVGGMAWELGPTLGAAIWALLPTAALPQPESYGLAALFPVWQPVIALFIGWATFENRKPVPTGASELQLEKSAPLPQTSGGLGRRAFVIIFVCLVVLSLMGIISVRLRQAHRDLIAAKKRASRPSFVDLPLPQPMSEQEALIVREIGGYQPGHALKRLEPVSHQKNFEMPSSMYLGVLYARTGELVPQWPLAPKQYISVYGSAISEQRVGAVFRGISPDDVHLA
jgi:hypothetical protein